MTEEAPSSAPAEEPASAAGGVPADAPPEAASFGKGPEPDAAPSVTLSDGAPAPSGAPPVAAPASGPIWRPNYVFLAIVSIVSLALDLGSKWWAKARLDDLKSFDRNIEIVKDHLSLRFARNQGGAWGLLQDEPESIRRPFFLGISVLAIVFIVSLYRKLTPRQWALKWGLPLVLGGALGNLVNRIQFNYVVDFIDYRAGWVRWLNGLISHRPTDHWPTFNIADVAIVAGVILMAIDMFTPRKSTVAPAAPAPAPADAAAPKET